MISKQQFEEAYKKFPPTRFEKFYTKHIIMSHNTFKKSWIALIISFLLFIPLIIRFLFEIQIVPVDCIHLMGYFYSFLLAFIGANWYTLWNLKRTRYNKIRKELGISEQEFYKIIKAYYFNDYDNSFDFIKYNTKNKCD